MLDEMKEVGDRSKHSGTVVKRKSSSGCLIIKKKVADSVAGVSGFSGSSSRNLFKSPKEKKRRRVVGSDSESSDSSSETIRQKVDKFHNGSVAYKGAYVETRQFETKKRATSGLDVFEFDEYDGFDDNRIRKDASDVRYNRWNLYRQSGDQMESGNGGSRPAYGTTSRFEMEDDESDLPLSVLRKKYRLSSSDKPIRLQGKNGVLKVMVNKNKRMGVSHNSYHHAIADNQKEPKPSVVQKKMLHRDAVDGQTSNKKKPEIKSSFYSYSKHVGKPVVFKSKEKSHSRGETVQNEGFVKKVGRIKGKESKVNRGSGTEKQILREKIKSMLIAAGWTIDYRPRRNRDYLDAVYISPSGTGYWSIIKAYDAFQKEEEDNSKDGGGNFTPLPDEILGKLTRHTRKKMEREMKKKRKSEDEDEEKLNSYERKSRKIGRCSLLVRGSDKAENDDGFVPYSGKRTLVSWLIDSGVVRMGEHVEYMNSRKTRILQKGWITKDGILCGCCNKIVTVLKFEMHAGSKVGQPFSNMFLESGKSLMQCQIDAWNKQGKLERKGFYNVDVDGDDDPNDDTCGLCGDGGDLICCDGCPSTFHQTCLDIKMLPQGDWLCPNCSCKYCELACMNSTQTSLVTCCLCQKKYHESCRPEIDVKPLESNYPNLSFCGHTCHEVYSQLQKLVGVKHELDSEFSWSLIHRSDLMTDASSSVQLSQRVQCNSMLAVAMSVMDECFLPFTDRRSGINLIRNVVFNCGSNLSRLNYSGFYTAILEKGDEVVCAASIRIHGTQLAEMPFIGTRHIYRRQGLCRRLLSAIEVALSSLQVDKLIIPAVAEHMDTWTDVFGFHPLEESHKQELKFINMVVFPGTDMLEKPLAKVKREGKNTAEVDNCKADSGSQEEHFESNVVNESTTVQVASAASSKNIISSVIPCGPKLQHPEMESSSINPHSNNNVEAVAMQNDGTNLLPTQLISEEQPVSINSLSDTNVDVINGCENANNATDVISHEAQDPKVPSNNNVSSDAPCESLSMRRVQESSASADETEKHSYGSEMNTQEKQIGLPDSEAGKDLSGQHSDEENPCTSSVV